MNIAVNVTIDASPEIVFDYFTNTDKLTQWQTFLAEAEQLGTGTVGVGSRFRNVLRHPGFGTSGILSLELIGKVLAFEPLKHLRIETSSNLVDLIVDYTFHGEAHQTVVKQNANFKIKGLVLRPFAHLLHDFVQQQFQQDFQQLKALCESK